MQHVLVRAQNEVPHHLHRLCILQLDMLFFDHALHEVLMDDFAETSPHVPVVHDEQMVTSGNNTVAHEGGRPIAVHGTLLVD